MQAGKLDRRITIVRRPTPEERGRDSFGAEIEDWVVVCQAWANVRPVSGREFLQGHQQGQEVMNTVRIRYRKGITPSMRVRLDVKDYDIVYVQDVDTGHRELVMTCRELLGKELT